MSSVASYETAGTTDIGPSRKENQDALAVVQRPAGGVALLLADGMGGHPGGLEAATDAVSAAKAVIESAGVPADLSAAVHAASAAVAELARRMGGAPGTTLLLADVSGSQATVANVGDSRGYHVRRGVAQPITQDHSWVAEELRAGRLAAGDARHHYRRNVITRAVMGEAIEPDLFEVALQPGDVLMLCSDGVWEPLEEQHIGEFLSGDEPLERLLQRLVQAALDAGGTDNATAVALRVPTPG